jgi:WD40 repeat protein
MAAQQNRVPEPLYVLRGHTAAINCLAVEKLSNGVTVVFSGSADGVVGVWNLQTRRNVVPSFFAHRGTGVLSVHVVFGGCGLLTQGKDGFCTVWKLQALKNGTVLVDTLAPLLVILTQSFSFLKVAVLEAGRVHSLADRTPCEDIASAGLDDATHAPLEHPCKEGGEEGSMLSCLVSAEETGKRLCVWDLVSSTLAICVDPAEDTDTKLGMLMGVEVLPRGAHSALVVVATESGHLLVYDLTLAVPQLPNEEGLEGKDTKRVLPVPTLRCGPTLLHEEPSICLRATLTSDVKLNRTVLSGISGSAGSFLVRFQVVLTGEEDATDGIHSQKLTLQTPGTAHIAIRHDRKLFATGGWDKKVRVFGWKQGKPLAVLPFHSKTVHAVAFGPAGIFVSAAGDSRIAVYNLYPPS